MCATDPATVLLVPGVEPCGWQAALADARPDWPTLDPPPGDDPVRTLWLGRLDRAVAAARGRRIVLAGDGAGALAIAWWGALLGRRAGRQVAGALLVAPPYPGSAGLGDLAPAPAAMLPFPTIVLTGDGDREQARACAAEWVADIVDAGPDAAARLIELLADGGPGVSRYTYRREPVLPAARRPVRPNRRPVAQRL